MHLEEQINLKSYATDNYKGCGPLCFSCGDYP